jgi:peptide/nickel transport system substrate-binding protein
VDGAMKTIGSMVLATALATGLLSGAALAAQDTLSLGMVLEPPNLDPTAGAASAIREVTYANLFEGLTRIDAEGAVKPGLAQSWEISPDGLTYRFHLHAGVHFHDGAAFDCSVVQFSYARAVAPDSTNAQKGLFEPIARTDCPDPLTAVVTLKHQAANFLFDMGWGDAVMVSPASAAGNKTHPVGTGPFRFVRWVQGDRVDLQRFPGYWGTPAKLSAVSFRFIADPAAATAALLAGDLDAFSNFPAPETLPQLRADSRFTVAVGTTEGKTILALNDTRKPFDDVRVRRALAYAIDRRALSAALFSGLAPPIGSHYTPSDPDYVDLANTYPFDPARARQLLKEAGVAPGTRFTIALPPPPYARRSGEIIAAELQDVGLAVDLEPIEWAQWLDRVFNRSDFDMTIIAHTEARDLDIYARDHYYFNYQNPGYKSLYAQYLAALTPAAQKPLLVGLQRKLAEDEPNVFLFALPKIGVWNANLHGLWRNDPIPANDVTAVYWGQ